MVPTSNSRMRVTTANNVAPAGQMAGGANISARASVTGESDEQKVRRLKKELADLIKADEQGSDEYESRLADLLVLEPTYVPPNQVRSSQD